MSTRRSASKAIRSISLLGCLAVYVDGKALSLTADAERLVAFLAVQDRSASRAHVAGSLWSFGTQDRAFGNLRSALWRLRRSDNHIVEAAGHTLAIAPDVTIDVRQVAGVARSLEDPRQPVENLPRVSAFTAELLPGWYEDWVIFERECHRQRALHALETLARRLAERHCYGPAIQAALAAIEMDPLRESSHHQLIEIHLAERNYSEALRVYHQYRLLVSSELGIEPSNQIKNLIQVTPPRP